MVDRVEYPNAPTAREWTWSLAMGAALSVPTGLLVASLAWIFVPHVYFYFGSPPILSAAFGLALVSCPVFVVGYPFVAQVLIRDWSRGRGPSGVGGKAGPAQE